MKLVYSYYVLDIVHKGHLLMMKNAKAMAGKDGKLIVGILSLYPYSYIVETVEKFQLLLFIEIHI